MTGVADRIVCSRKKPAREVTKQGDYEERLIVLGQLFFHPFLTTKLSAEINFNLEDRVTSSLDPLTIEVWLGRPFGKN